MKYQVLIQEMLKNRNLHKSCIDKTPKIRYN